MLGTIVCLLKNYRPFMFFSSLTIILIILAATFFIPILIAFIQTGIVEKIPTLIVCGFVVLAALDSFFSGLILSSIVSKDKRDFEKILQQVQQYYYELMKQN